MGAHLRVLSASLRQTPVPISAVPDRLHGGPPTNHNQTIGGWRPRTCVFRSSSPRPDVDRRCRLASGPVVRSRPAYSVRAACGVSPAARGRRDRDGSARRVGRRALASGVAVRGRTVGTRRCWGWSSPLAIGFPPPYPGSRERYRRYGTGGANLGDVSVRIGDETPFHYSEISGDALRTLRFVAFHTVAPVQSQAPQMALRPGSYRAMVRGSHSRDCRRRPQRNTRSLNPAQRPGGLFLCGGSPRRRPDAPWVRRGSRRVGPQIDHVLTTAEIAADLLAEDIYAFMRSGYRVLAGPGWTAWIAGPGLPNPYANLGGSHMRTLSHGRPERALTSNGAPRNRPPAPQPGPLLNGPLRARRNTRMPF